MDSDNQVTLQNFLTGTLKVPRYPLVFFLFVRKCIPIKNWCNISLFRTGEWKGRNWMRSKLGPKMDHVCIPYKDMIVSVGGWNNNLINQTEIYSENTWSIIENKTSLAIRSATTIQLNTKPYLLGGVNCIGSENERKICTKVADIYEFSDDTNEWSLTELQMTVARSSHLAIHAPVTYFPSCTP